jgi:hypothetical protein
MPFNLEAHFKYFKTSDAKFLHQASLGYILRNKSPHDQAYYNHKAIYALLEFTLASYHVYVLPDSPFKCIRFHGFCAISYRAKCY